MDLKLFGLIVFAVAVITHLLCSYTVSTVGKRFYTEKNWVETSPQVFDVGHSVLPNHSQNTMLRALNDTIALSAFVLAYVFGLYQFYLYWLIILAIRGIANLVTILPKEETCDDSNLSLFHVVRGQCYDKIFSGHFSTVFLFTVLALRTYGSACIYPIVGGALSLYAMLILLIRTHYTIDILVSVAVVFAILQVPVPKS